MEDNKFKPEEKFEKENLDIINSLQEIKDAQLNDDFDLEIFKEIKSLKKEKIFTGFAEKFLFKKYINKVAYSFGLVTIVALCFFIFYPSHNTEKGNSGLIQNDTYNNGTFEIQKDTPGKFGKKLEREKIEKILNLVKRDMSYGLFNKVSRKDVQYQLGSIEFKENMSKIKNPVIEDTIRVIVELFENMKKR